MSVRRATSFERPASVAEALALVSAGGVPVSGGTSVILRSHLEPCALVDLTALGHDDIDADDAGITIGANVTLTAMLEHADLAALSGGVMSRMLRGVGSPLLRNVATLGGHIARGRLSDVVPVLLALDAELAFFDGSDRTLSLADFYRDGLHRTPMIVTQVRIPRLAGSSAAHFEKMARTFFDIALLNAACRIDLDAGVVAAARVVVGETPALATRITEAEEALLGRPLAADVVDAAAATAAAHTRVADDERASAQYRRHLVPVLVGRCLHAAREALQ